MKKTIWIYGLIAGFICSVWMFVGLLFMNGEAEMGGNEVMGYVIQIVAYVTIFVGLKNYRDKNGNGEISFAKAFKMGALMSLIAATIYVICWSIDYNFFVPDFGEKYAAYMLENAKKSNLTPAEIEEQVAKFSQYKEMYKNPFFFVLITYMEVIPVGLLASLISALILKKKAKNVA